MQIYYRCSFKASSGYKLALYDAASGRLSYIGERDGDDKKGMPKAVLSSLQLELGRSMMLASDGQGNFFLGIYKLVKGDFEKYVNAVFVDKDQEKIVGLFERFCSEYSRMNSHLQNTVKRKPPDENGLEFGIAKDEIDKLLGAAGAREGRIRIKAGRNMLYAYVSEGDCGDYLERVKNKCGLNVQKAALVSGILCGQERVEIGRAAAVPKKWVPCVVGVLLVAALVAGLLVFLLYYKPRGFTTAQPVKVSCWRFAAEFTVSLGGVQYTYGWWLGVK